jgi:hypothetical protein
MIYKAERSNWLAEAQATLAMDSMGRHLITTMDLIHSERIKELIHHIEALEAGMASDRRDVTRVDDEGFIEQRCSVCKLYYPLEPEFFYRDKSRKTGLAFKCKACADTITERHRVRKREKIHEQAVSSL